MAALNVVVDQLLSCACMALEEADRPACSCYPVIGNPIWRPCCNCGGSDASGELTASLDNMYPADNDLNQVSRLESCRRGSWAVDIILTLTRCYPMVSGSVDLPDPDDVEAAARQLHDDADTLRRALTCCPDLRLAWRGLGVDTDPEAGCSSLRARVTVGL